MEKVILHIGRHKTGTSSVQRFLFENPEFLISNGFFYPLRLIEKGFAHHTYAEVLAQVKHKHHDYDLLHSHVTNKYEEFKSGLSDKFVNIVSSEGFQNCSPELLRSLLNPFEVDVKVYIRNELDYLASSYVQKVHATSYIKSIDEYSDSFNVDYLRFLDSWSNAFNGRINARIYSKERLLNSDVVDDFVSNFLNISDLPEYREKIYANPSLGVNVLKFKIFLNQNGYINDMNRARSYKVLGEMSKGDVKIRLPESLYRKMVPQYEKSQAKWCGKYFSSDKVFDYDSYDYLNDDFFYDELSSDEIKGMLCRFEAGLDLLANKGLR